MENSLIDRCEHWLAGVWTGNKLNCPWCQIERLRSERNAYRALAGIGLTGTDEADELSVLEPLERDREAYRRIQERFLTSMKAAADAARSKE